MSINSSNIDKWLFDYYEGNLSPNDIRKLEQFLKNNPEYYEDADAWKDSFVEESLPAFSPAFLVKEPQTKNRKKLAYAALLLLLLSGSTTLYFLLSTGNTTKDQTAATVTAHGNGTDAFVPFASNKKATNIQPGITVNYTTATTNTGNSNNEDAVDNAHLSFTPEIERVENMANAYRNTNGTLNNIGSNAVVNNYTTIVQVVPQHLNSANLTSSSTFVPAHQTNNVLVNNRASLLINNGPAIIANNYKGNSVNRYTEHNAAITENKAADPALTEVKAFNMNSGQAEDLNLTIEAAKNNPGPGEEKTLTTEPVEAIAKNTIGQHEEKAVNNQQAETLAQNTGENKSTVDAANKENKAVAPEVKNKEEKAPITDQNSGFGPDSFKDKKSTDEANKSVDIDKNNKTDLSPPKGLNFTNRRQVTLLQGINNEFENNASFVSQHHMADAYLGVRFINASPIERGIAETAGASHYFRNTKTTLNVYGQHNKTGQVEQTGIHLQVATQFKVDRYQSIIPSISLSANRYDFASLQEVATGKLAEYNIIPSYSAGQLFNSPVYYNYKDAFKMNVSAGVLYHHKKFFTGLSLNGLLQPKFTYEVNDREYTATNYATANFVVGTDFVSKKYPELSLSPQLTINIRNMEPDFAGGGVLRYKSWGVGAGLSASGALNTYAGYAHRSFGLQYRFVYDKLDAPFKGVSGHYVTMHMNLKSAIKKQKPILDDPR